MGTYLLENNAERRWASPIARRSLHRSIGAAFQTIVRSLELGNHLDANYFDSDGNCFDGYRAFQKRFEN